MNITAIIPSIGRLELRRAVDSVLSQSIPVEPLVVLDRPDQKDLVARLLQGLQYRLVTTRGNVGGAAARNFGVEASGSDVVAFLDDDDEWVPNKIERQLDLLVQQPEAIIASRAWLVGRGDRIIPETPFSGIGDVSSYLLSRQTLRLRKNFLQSSSFLMASDVARSTRWRDDLPRHQDWTLLIEHARSGGRIVTHPDPLVLVYQGSSHSISRSRDWKASLDWLDSIAKPTDQRSQADFLCSVVARAAFQDSAVREGARVLRRALPLRPHFAALGVALSGLFGR